jgi:ABC-type branched-subunit amino acid transport system permease subunit
MRYTKIGASLLLLIVAAIFPFVSPDATIISIGFFALLYACAAIAWNIFSGYTGYISLGHATFYGLGTYTLAIICEHWNIPGGYVPFLLLPVAGLVAALFALPLGWIALRTQHITFVVVTLAILFIFQLLAYNLSGITHGSRGMFFPFPPWSGDSYNFPFYYIALLLVIVTLSVSWWVLRSKYGLGLLAIRDDEDRALSLGVNTTRSKLSAFMLSAFFIGMVGALGSYFLGYISPSFAFSPAFDVAIALMVLFGGAGTLAGPILGALLLEPLQQYLTLQSNIRGADLVLFGGLLLIVLIVLPEGVIPAGRKRWQVWRNMRKANKAGSTPVLP